MRHGASRQCATGLTLLALASLMAEACTAREGEVARDTPAASARAASTTPKKHGGWKGDGVGGWTICEEGNAAPNFIALGFRGNTLEANDAEAAALYEAAYNECFIQDYGRDTSPVGLSGLTYDEADFPTTSGTVGLRFRPASYTHAMNPDAAPAGMGFIAGAYKHLRGPALMKAGGLKIVGIDRSVLLWMGKDKDNQLRYALLDLPRYPRRGTAPITAADVKLVVTGTLTSKPAQLKLSTSYARFTDPGPHAPGMSVPDGSWVECDAGCCVAGALAGLLGTHVRTHAVLTDSLVTDP